MIKSGFIRIVVQRCYDSTMHQHRMIYLPKYTFCDTNNNDSKNVSKTRVLYDGECYLCNHEINFLKNRDKNKNNIDFIDISKDDYKPNEHNNIDYRTGMKSMHVITKDGKMHNGIKAFKPMYNEVGLGWLWKFTDLPVIGSFSDKIYNKWAQYRLKITRRPDIETIIKQKNENRDESNQIR